MKKAVRDTPENSYELIRAQTSVFHGRQVIDVRTYAIPQSLQATTREHHPTRKGINLSLDRLPNLIAALEEIRRELEDDADA